MLGERCFLDKKVVYLPDAIYIFCMEDKYLKHLNLADAETRKLAFPTKIKDVTVQLGKVYHI